MWKWVHRGALLGALVLAVAVAAPARQTDVPTMTNSSLDPSAEPLPAGWPVGATDVQVRGAVCEGGYGKEAARAKAAAGDVLLPMIGHVPEGLQASYLGVRALPFVTKRDVLAAHFFANEGDPSTYTVRLKLDADGALKAQEYTSTHGGECIALVAGGKVVWYATIEAAVTDDTFLLSGAFTAAEAIGIVDLFEGR